MNIYQNLKIKKPNIGDLYRCSWNEYSLTFEGKRVETPMLVKYDRSLLVSYTIRRKNTYDKIARRVYWWIEGHERVDNIISMMRDSSKDYIFWFMEDVDFLLTDQNELWDIQSFFVPVLGSRRPAVNATRTLEIYNHLTHKLLLVKDDVISDYEHLKLFYTNPVYTLENEKYFLENLSLKEKEEKIQKLFIGKYINRIPNFSVEPIL